MESLCVSLCTAKIWPGEWQTAEQFLGEDRATERTQLTTQLNSTQLTTQPNPTQINRLTIWTLREYHSPEPIIISTDEADEVSIGDVALMVVKAMGFEGEVIYDTSKADGQFKKTASNKKLRSFLPDYKFISMQDGIQRAVDWFVENYETSRK